MQSIIASYYVFFFSTYRGMRLLLFFFFFNMFLLLCLFLVYAHIHIYRIQNLWLLCFSLSYIMLFSWHAVFQLYCLLHIKIPIHLKLRTIFLAIYFLEFTSSYSSLYSSNNFADADICHMYSGMTFCLAGIFCWF